MLVLSALLHLLAVCSPAQMPADVDPLHARLLVVGDYHFDGPFGRRLKRVLVDEMPTWKIEVKKAEKVDAATVAALIKDDETVIVVAAGSEFVRVSTSARAVEVGDLSEVAKIAELIVKERGRRCLWVGPPQQLGRRWARYAGAKTLSDRLSRALRAQARGCEYVDSLAYTRGGPATRFEDGLRPRTELAQRWAEEIAARIIRLVR